MFLIQWNLNGVNSHYGELKTLITKYRPEIIALQETHLRPSHSYNLKNYKVYRHDFLGGDRACGGVAILIKNTITSTQINLTSGNLQVIAVSISNASPYFKNLTICNIYIPPHQNISVDELEQIFNQLPFPYVVVGDFNAHSHSWGSNTSNNRGNVIDKFLTKSDAFLLNNGSHTHFNLTSGTSSAIDLSFSSPNIAHLIEWEVQDDLYFSDHYPINIKFSTQNQKRPGEKHPKWIINKANWQMYRHLIQLSHFSNMTFDTSSSSDNIDHSVEILTNSIIKAAQESIPKSSTKIPKHMVPWWCEELKSAITDRKRALRKFKKNRTQENLIKFKQKRAFARQLNLSKQRESFKDFMLSITHGLSAKEVWEKIRILKGSFIPSFIPFIEYENEILTTTKDIVNILALNFAKVSANESYDLQFQNLKNTTETCILNFDSDNSEEFNVPFSIDELNDVLNHHIKNSAPGPDDIHPFMIKYLPDHIKEILLDLYNKIWTSNQFPTTWKTAIIVPILKVGKDRTHPSSYRPISLTSVPCKILEKMVSRRLIWYIDKSHSVSNFQSGFRKKRSTTDHLFSLTNEISTAFQNKQSVLAVFFDLEKAYDKAWRYKILEKLHSIGVRGHLAFFIVNFLSERKFKVRINNTFSDLHEIENGVPQGSVLSTILFILLIDSIRYVVSRPVSLRIFADDINISISAKNLELARQIIQDTLDRIEQWASSNGLSFSKSKTHGVIFTKKNKIQKPTLSLNRQTLQIKSSTKFLGLTLNKKLTWTPHFLQIKQDLMKTLNLLKIIKNPKYNPSRNVLLQIYRSLVRSKLEYGCPAFKKASKKTLSIINTVQNSALRMCIGALPSSPIDSIYCEAAELPPEFRRNLISNKFLVSAVTDPTNPIRTTIHSCIKNRNLYNESLITDFLSVLENNNIPLSDLNHENPKFPQWLIQLPDINLTMINYRKNEYPHHIIRRLYQEKLYEYKGFIQCFTDGSKIETDYVGYAFSINGIVKNYTIQKYSSIFTAESIAILHCLLTIPTLDFQNKKFLIQSDSLSALTSIQNKFSTNPIVNHIHHQLLFLKTLNFDIKLMYIPSHVEILGNDEIDHHAKSATTFSTVNFLPLQDLKNLLIQTELSKWQNLWSTKTQNKLYQHKKSIKPWKNLSHLNRTDEVTITRLRIGHTKFTHNHLFQKSPKPTCHFCHADLISVQHLLFECPNLNQTRSHLKIQTTNPNIPDDEAEINKFLSFISKIKLNNQI